MIIKMKTIRFLTLGGLCFFLGSCSRVDLALNWADTFLYYELKGQFDFKGLQKDVTEKVADQFVADMKKDWIPQLADRLKILGDKIEIAKEDAFKKIFQDEALFLETHFKKIFVIGSAQVPAIAKTLTKENWTHFQRKFEEKNKEIISKEEKSKMLENLESFTGPLNKDQRQMVTQWLIENPNDNKLRVDNRKHVMNQLNQKIDPWSSTKWSEIVVAWATSPDDFQLAAYKEAVKKRTASMLGLFEKIVKSMTAKQKAEVKKNLHRWAERLSSGAKK